MKFDDVFNDLSVVSDAGGGFEGYIHRKLTPLIPHFFHRNYRHIFGKKQQQKNMFGVN